MKSVAERDALLEIGTEEIPARFMPAALAQLTRFLEAGLSTAGVDVKAVETWGTPRRMTVHLKGLSPRSKDRTDVAIGPPPKAAKTEQGEWTAAATGFAKAQNVHVEKLVLQNTMKGDRYVALHLVKGQKTEAVLKELFSSAISALAFPKSMIWDDKEIHFARPIRWIVALYGNAVVRFKVAGISSDRATVGLLALGGLKIPIARCEKYKTVLQGRCILVDPAERRKNIVNQIESLTKKIKASAIMEDSHLEEVVFLTEYPVSILGHFPEAYLKLPREILVSVLKKHQKFFPIESSKGQLTNAFIGVRNGPSESQEDVREGYERVVNARFSDAQFFYEKDSATRLEDLVQSLSGVGFHEKLGSMYDKTERVRRLVRTFGPLINLSESTIATADRAAFLSKADLLTQMVGEFPELQGIAGRFYGEKQEKPEVAQAIEQHYWPLTAESTLPKTEEAALVSIADKMDTLAANFSVGLVPSGSADPYGLRRMAAGIIRILLERKWNVPLKKLVQLAFENLGRGQASEKEQQLEEFFNQRCLTWFGAQGFRPDEIDAVLSINGGSLAILLEKLHGLKTVRGRPEFTSLAQAIKRARNILTQAQEKGMIPASVEIVDGELQGTQEQSLYNTLNHIRPIFSSAIDSRDFQKALLALAPLKEPVDAFFDGVKVMVDDEQARSQRLRLLMQVKGMFDHLADFSRLQMGSTTAA